MPACRTAPSDVGACSFPLCSHQATPSLSGVLGFAGLAALAAAVLIPLFGLTIYGLTDAGVRLELGRHPIVAFEIAAALALWSLIFGWPLKRRFFDLTHRRSAIVLPGAVAGDDRRLFTRTCWTEPLANYRGIAHQIRSSLAGTRHEMVLVHTRAERTVVLRTAEHISEADMARIAALLRLPQIPARMVSTRTRTCEPFLPAAVRPLATAA